ncbi:MAG: fibronectin type III domain-containing protein [Terriglobales bacterium]
MWNRTAILPIAVVVVFGAATFCAAQNAQITKGPTIEAATDTSAIIAWSTNVNSSTVVRYGTDPNNLDQTAQVPWGGLTHRVTLEQLQPDTTYYFKVESGQAQGTGTSASSEVSSFRTKAAGEK